MRLQVVFLLIAIFLLEPARGAAGQDWSLSAVCENHGGNHVKSDSKEKGDICTLTLPVFTEDQEDADEFCQNTFPYHILKATPGDKTVCKAEATLVCRSGWIQMYGRCYKMTKELMTYADASKHCTGILGDDKKPLGARIAFLHREPIVARWKDYFTRVSRMWLDASTVFTKDLLYNKGPNMLVVFYGYHFRVRPMSLIRVPEHENAMVLCEYTPPMTQAESNYLMRRYNEIYYKAIQTSEGSYFRTSSSRNRVQDTKTADSEYCNRVVSPVLRTVGAITAVPTKGFTEMLVEDNSASIIRTSAYSSESKEANRNHPTCSVSTKKIYGVDLRIATKVSNVVVDDIWRSGHPKEQCDGASWSTGFSLSRTKNSTGLEDMSDARSAPIYCQTLFETQEYDDCPTGYTPYERANGQKWCHKFIREEPTNIKDSEARCAKEDSFLSGYTDRKELELIESISTSEGSFVIKGNVWLGAKRRAECIKLGSGTTLGYELDKNSPCSKSRVFEWKNGVASNPPNILNDWLTNNPNYQSESETCLELVKIWTGNWYNKPDSKHKLNDNDCDVRNHVLCGREAPIVIRAPMT